jgi:hypothetical protein
MLPSQADTDPMVSGEGQGEKSMTTMTAFDLRLTDHLMRTARVNHRGWIWQASRTTDVVSGPQSTTLLASIRQRVGASMVRVGERLQGAPISHIADRAAV